MENKKLSVVVGAALAAFTAGTLHASDLDKSKDMSGNWIVAEGKDGGCKDGACKDGACKGAKKKAAKKKGKKADAAADAAGGEKKPEEKPAQ